MTKKSSYPQDIAVISVVFIFLIIFIAIVNLYVSSSLRTVFVNAHHERIYSFARICSIYLNTSEKEKFIKPVAEAYNIGNIVITDSTGKKIYDSFFRFPGMTFDNIGIFHKLPEPGKIIHQGNNLVYHNPEPDFYLYIFNHPGYFTIDNLFRWHLIYITISLIFISFLGFFLIRNLFLPMRYVAGVARKYGVEIKKEDFVPATFNEIFKKIKDKEQELLELSAYIAHEFRNSLATITGLARLIEKGKREPSDIVKECNIMDGLITSLLEYSRPMRFMKTEFNLVDLLDEAIYKTDIPERIAIEKDFNYQGKINADYELLLSAIVNILKNSIEAIDNTGKIELATYLEEGSIAISISDTGKGIPRDVIKDIFSPFYSSKREGTGLGLAFVKKVVDVHDGRISVDSNLGKGTRFKILIPRGL